MEVQNLSGLRSRLKTDPCVLAREILRSLNEVSANEQQRYFAIIQGMIKVTISVDESLRNVREFVEALLLSSEPLARPVLHHALVGALRGNVCFCLSLLTQWRLDECLSYGNEDAEQDLKLWVRETLLKFPESRTLFAQLLRLSESGFSMSQEQIHTVHILWMSVFVIDSELWFGGFTARSTRSNTYEGIFSLRDSLDGWERYGVGDLNLPAWQKMAVRIAYVENGKLRRILGDNFREEHFQ